MNVGRTIDEAGAAVERHTAADGTLLAAYVASEDYDSNGSPAPPEWERLRTAYQDANDDQNIDLYDWYGFQVCEGVTTSSGGMNDHLCLFLYDLDGDGEVTFDEGQQGCNLFTGTWGTPGDGHPGQATGSRFGNPFMWTGQRYDAPVGLYHFLFRSYSPTLGRWLQRDPLGYIAGFALYESVFSSPSSMTDPLGLEPDQGGYEEYTDALGPDCRPFSVQGRQNTRELGPLFDPEMQQNLENGYAANDAFLAQGLAETATVLATAIWDGYNYLSYLSLARLAAKATIKLGITAVRTGGKLIFMRGGKKIAQEEAEQLIKGEVDDLVRAIRKVKPKKPPLPPGFSSLRQFGKMIGWGTGPDDALRTLNNLSVADIRRIKAAGITSADIAAWRDFYLDFAIYVGTKSAVNTPNNRAELLQGMLALWNAT